MSLLFSRISKKQKRVPVLAYLMGACVLDENRSLEYDYCDEYLKKEINKSTELRAKTQINYLKLKNEFFIAKLVVLKTYIICCLENQTSADDLFAVKLKQYKAEFESVQALALQDKAQNELKDSFINAFNAPLLRG